MKQVSFVAALLLVASAAAVELEWRKTENVASEGARVGLNRPPSPSKDGVTAFLETSSIPPPVAMPATGAAVPPWVTGMPQPYPMASPYTLGHVYGGYGVPVHPGFRAMHALIGAPPPPLIPYGAPFYPPYQ